MQKRTLLAVVLSAIVLAGYSMFVAKMYPPKSHEQIQTNQTISEKQELDRPVIKEVEQKPLVKTLGKIQKTTTKEYEIGFDAVNAYITDIYIKNYKQEYPSINALVTSISSSSPFTAKQGDDNLVFISQDKNVIVKKEITFLNSNNSINLEINIENKSSDPIIKNQEIILIELKSDDRMLELMGIGSGNTVLRKNIFGLKKELILQGQFLNMGLRDRYFCFLLNSPKAGKVFARPVSEGKIQIGLDLGSVTLNPGETLSEKFSAYIGPQITDNIVKASPAWRYTISFGFFDGISKAILFALEMFHKVTFNWGLATIGLSLFIFIVFSPLTIKQLKSMKDMQAIQPKIEVLRTQYKDNPQRLNKEIMELYKYHKVNPFSGCLPLLFQAPIFFALYQALMRSLDLRGASFLWIKDLSEPDKLFILKDSLPLIGNQINLLPLLMAATMFFQQKVSMKSAATMQSKEQMKIMLVLMPVMFGFLFYHFPSGLGLYWFVYSLMSFVFQWKTSLAK